MSQKSIEDSPDWLPNGWIMEVKTRKTGSSAGTKYRCYMDPSNGCKFYSRVQVLRYLQNGKDDNDTLTFRTDSTPSPSIDNDILPMEESPDLQLGWINHDKMRENNSSCKAKNDQHSGSAPVEKQIVTRRSLFSSKISDEKQKVRGSNDQSSSQENRALDDSPSVKKEDTQQKSVSSRNKISNGRSNEIVQHENRSTLLQKESKCPDVKKQVDYEDHNPPSGLVLNNECPKENFSVAESVGQSETKKMADSEDRQQLENQSKYLGYAYPINSYHCIMDEMEKKNVQSMEYQHDSVQNDANQPLEKKNLNLEENEPLENEKEEGRSKRRRKSIDVPRRASKRLAGIKVDPLPDIMIRERTPRSSVKNSSNLKPVCEGNGSKGRSIQPVVQNKQDTQPDEVIKAPTERDRPKPINDKQDEQNQFSLINSPFGDTWLDPCLEFAIKTLTGAIPVPEDDPAIQIFFRNHLNLARTSTSPKTTYDLPCALENVIESSGKMNNANNHR